MPKVATSFFFSGIEHKTKAVPHFFLSLQNKIAFINFKIQRT